MRLSHWLKRPRQARQNGDTIVEVLIVIVVVASVLGSAYSIAVRSLQVMQLSQERGYGLKTAQGQLERFKSYLNSGGTDAVALYNRATSGFCMNSASGSLQPVDFRRGSSPTVDMDTEDYANYGASCVQNSNGQPCAADELCYYYGLRRMENASQPNSITATVRWDGPAGRRQQVQLTYRIYP